MLRKCRRLIIEENFMLASSSDARVTQVARNIATIDVADNITVAIEQSSVSEDIVIFSQLMLLREQRITVRVDARMTPDQERAWMSTWAGSGAGSSSEYLFQPPSDEQSELRVAHCPLFDDEPFARQHAAALLRNASTFIGQALDAGESVYVHCKHGASRSASIVVCYLMEHRAMTLLEAVSWVKDKRAKAGPNDGFLDVLLELEENLRGARSDRDEVLSVVRRKWLADYKSGRVQLNRMDRII
ncbi:Dual specificity protein phosphatase 1 [Symbiodinium microadriaticum]|uniref:Dual specificity protein phosphatase 1 n=1 Tax=Symbiodinium microadriaticum TaxID=2951 RepID=A0A1Q9E2R6_SYMMI|nr:Dual specificity protein phosphatase 1 [Symbiodinium microadriaticum]